MRFCWFVVSLLARIPAPAATAMPTVTVLAIEKSAAARMVPAVRLKIVIQDVGIQKGLLTVVNTGPLRDKMAREEASTDHDEAGNLSRVKG